MTSVLLFLKLIMNVMKQNNFQARMNFGIVEIIANYGEMPNSD